MKTLKLLSLISVAPFTTQAMDCRLQVFAWNGSRTANVTLERNVSVDPAAIVWEDWDSEAHKSSLATLKSLTGSPRVISLEYRSQKGPAKLRFQLEFDSMLPEGATKSTLGLVAESDTAVAGQYISAEGDLVQKYRGQKKQEVSAQITCDLQ